jgi:hypothetical protein
MVLKRMVLKRMVLKRMVKNQKRTKKEAVGTATAAICVRVAVPPPVGRGNRGLILAEGENRAVTCVTCATVATAVTCVTCVTCAEVVLPAASLRVKSFRL